MHVGRPNCGWICYWVNTSGLSTSLRRMTEPQLSVLSMTVPLYNVSATDFLKIRFLWVGSVVRHQSATLHSEPDVQDTDPGGQLRGEWRVEGLALGNGPAVKCHTVTTMSLVVVNLNGLTYHVCLAVQGKTMVQCPVYTSGSNSCHDEVEQVDGDAFLTPWAESGVKHSEFVMQRTLIL